MHISVYVGYSDLALRSPDRTSETRIMDPVRLIHGPDTHTSQHRSYPIIPAREGERWREDNCVDARAATVVEDWIGLHTLNESGRVMLALYNTVVT